VRSQAAQRRIILSQQLDRELGEVEADQRKVRQILVNLLSNAVKFTPDGGRVVVSGARADGQVRISVSDMGVGIAAEELGRVFREFGQTASARGQEGTGLGLALTKRLVELHGGRIWVESAPSQGSTFAFTLPVASVPDEDLREPSSR
jgi:signal transduction histidine kinase